MFVEVLKNQYFCICFAQSFSFHKTTFQNFNKHPIFKVILLIFFIYSTVFSNFYLSMLLLFHHLTSAPIESVRIGFPGSNNPWLPTFSVAHWSLLASFSLVVFSHFPHFAPQVHFPAVRANRECQIRIPRGQ